jgi:hypothetical protein
MYLKITNSSEKHFGLQYHDGLNIDPLPFAKEGSCVPGGIYFTTPEYIYDFLEGGTYVREVTIPEDAEMVKDPAGEKWRASKVILGTRKPLGEVATWKWLGDCGVDIHNNYFLREACENGHLEVVKYLAEHDNDIRYERDWALLAASNFHQMEIVKYLLVNGADIHVGNDIVLRTAIYDGNLDGVKWLIAHGANIRCCDSYVIRYCEQRGRLDLVEYLKEQIYKE